MRAIFLLLTLLLLTSGQAMDPPAIVWVKYYFEDDYGEFHDVHETSDGCFILAGGHLLASGGSGNKSIYKIDSIGDSLWSSGSTGFDYQAGFWVEELADHSYIVSGSCGIPDASTASVMLFKSDSAGNQIWCKTFDFPGTHDYGNCVVPLQNGFGIAGTSGSKVFVIRTDLQGDSLWSAMYEGPTSLNARRIVEVDDKLIVFATGLVLRILAYDSDNGQLLWVVDNLPGFLGSGYKDGGDMTLSTSDNGFTLVNHYQPYIVHTDSLGNVLWYYEIPYTERPLGYSINTAMDNGYIYCGMNTGYDPNNPESAWSGMVVRYDSEGQELWRDYVYEALSLHSIRQLSFGGYIACGGEGVAYIIRYAPETGIHEPEPSDSLSLDAFPNPCNSILSVSFCQPEAGHASIRVYDLGGRLVSTVAYGQFQAGTNSVEWAVPEDISSGCYFVQYNSDIGSRTESVVLIK